MSDDPSKPEDVIPLARPVAPPSAPLVEARAISQPVAVVGGLGPMHLQDTRAVAVWLDLGAFVVAMVVGSLALSVIARSVLALVPSLEERVLKASLIPVLAALSIGVVALILRARRQSARSVGLTADKLLVNTLLGLAALAAAFAAFYAFMLMLIIAEPGVIALMEENTEAITQMLPRMHPILMVSLMAIVGFYEELVFRGFLLTRVRRVSGSWWIAVAVTSFLFAVLHVTEQQPVAVLPLFGLGVAFSVFTIWRKSLIPAMISHGLFNSAQLLFLYYARPDWS